MKADADHNAAQRNGRGRSKSKSLDVIKRAASPLVARPLWVDSGSNGKSCCLARTRSFFDLAGSMTALHGLDGWVTDPFDSFVPVTPFASLGQANVQRRTMPFCGR